MKKLISLITVFSMLILALVSCGEQTVPSERVASPQTAAPTGEPIMSDEPSTTGSTPSQGATDPTGTPEESTTENGTADPNDTVPSG